MPELKVKCRAAEHVLRSYQKVREEMWSVWASTRGSATRVCGSCASSYCCYQLPLAHLVEGVVAAHYLIANDRAQDIDHAMGQGQRQNAIWGTSFDSLSRCKTLEEAEAVAGSGAGAWYKLREPCCFLHNDRCTIYPVRPSMCATYFIKNRCTRWLPADADVPTMDNSDVIAAVMDASDMALAVLIGDSAVRTAPAPFAFTVGVGARLLAGQPVEGLAIGGQR